MTLYDFIPIVADLRQEFLSEDISALVTRSEESLIELKSNLAQVIIGVRRCGKSTLCRKVLRQAEVKAAYINFDDERLVNLRGEELNDLLEAVYIVYGEIDYLLLDEIQNVESWPLFVNRLLRNKLHLLITGSNAKLLSTELVTHLTGRCHTIELFPFSFSEFAACKKLDLNDLSTFGTAVAKRCLEEYLIQGGFPELLTENDHKNYINGLLHAIIKRDIAQRFKVRYPDVLSKLADYCIDNFAQEINVGKLASEFNVSDHTVSTYMEYLKEAFLLLGITKFSYKSLERMRRNKNYVVDTAFISDREKTFIGANLGWRLENVVYVELLRRSSRLGNDVFFYRDRNFEIDFIVSQRGRVEQLIQVCFDMSNEKTRRRELRALDYARKKFDCHKLTIVTMNEHEIVEIDNDRVEIVPAIRWLAE